MYLEHHGIKGQKWGERKYQYKDGSLTPEGRKRYGVGEYVKNRYNARKTLSKDYKRANSKFQRELADIEKNTKGSAQNKPVIRAAKKYDKARENSRQKYKAAVKAENERLKQSSRQYRSDLKRGLADKATKTKNFAKMYHDVSKVEMKELMNPSSTGEMIFSGARAKLHGRSFASGHREYAYRKSIDYARKKYGDSAATKIETTDAAFRTALYVGAAAFGVYRAYKSTHPTYELP